MKKYPLIKIYGERNTGTNYLHKLINLNVDAKILPGIVPRYIKLLQKLVPGEEVIRDIYFSYSFSKNFGWKHSLVKPASSLKRVKICSNNLFFLTLAKNPYSWLLSLYNRSYHYQGETGSFDDFLRAPWITVRRENSPCEFKNPIDMWNKKNASYVDLGTDFKVLNLTYENLLLNPENIIKDIRNFLSLNNQAPLFKNIDQSTKNDNKDFSFYKKYYLRELWKEKLSQSSIDIINQNLDRELVEYYGYKILTRLC